MALLAGCQQHRLPGHVVGNGGGLLQQRFDVGREDAREAVLRLSDERIAETGAPVEADDRWLVDHRQEVADEIMNMPWGDPNSSPIDCPQHGPQWCLCTTPDQLGASVYVSESSCKAATDAEAGRLMLHEALHHFKYLGADEKRVYRLSALVYRRWAHLSAYRAQMNVAPPRGAETAGISTWNGEALITWNPKSENRFYLYRPGEGWSEKQFRSAPNWTNDATHAPRETHAALFPIGTRKIYALGFVKDPKSADEDYTMGMRDIEVDLESGIWHVSSRSREDLWRVSEEKEHRPAPTKPGGTVDSAISQVGMFLRGFAAGVSSQAYALYPGLLTSLMWGEQKVSFYFPKQSGEELRWRTTSLPSPASWDKPMLIGVPQGLFVYRAADANGEGGAGLWFDSRQEKWTPLAPGGPTPQDGRVLAAVDGDTIHVMGESWMAYSLRRRKWELVQAKVGSLVDASSQVYMTSAGALFWDDHSRRGVIWAR